MRIAAIVLAAGEGRRIGRPKALLSIGGRSFLAHVCGLFGEARVDHVMAVLGAEAQRVRAEAGVPDGVTVVVNEAWRDGMLTSIWRGLDEADAEGVDAVLVHPVDNPLVSLATIRTVVRSLRGGALVAVPACGGRRGHPAGFARASWPALRAASPAVGARSVLLEHAEWVQLESAGPDSLVDVDTPEAYARLCAAAPPDRA